MIYLLFVSDLVVKKERMNKACNLFKAGIYLSIRLDGQMGFLR